MGEPLPALLTVEEAAELLRIGRTKAYAMAKQWRASGGAFGLPVIDFGDVLRVPLAQLESMTGAAFADMALRRQKEKLCESSPPEGPRGTPSPLNAVGSTTEHAPASRRRSKAGTGQLDLFSGSSASD